MSGDKNINGDLLLDCHECANAKLGPHQATGGYQNQCKITGEIAMVRCEDWSYKQFGGLLDDLPVLLQEQAGFKGCE